jgi:hypothetical protein
MSTLQFVTGEGLADVLSENGPHDHVFLSELDFAPWPDARGRRPSGPHPLRPMPSVETASANFKSAREGSLK